MPEGRVGFRDRRLGGACGAQRLEGPPPHVRPEGIRLPGPSPFRSPADYALTTRLVASRRPARVSGGKRQVTALTPLYPSFQLTPIDATPRLRPHAGCPVTLDPGNKGPVARDGLWRPFNPSFSQRPSMPPFRPSGPMLVAPCHSTPVKWRETACGAPSL
jgi:hypothetical protein